MSKVVVLGSSNMDLVLRSDRLPQPGETVLGTDFFQTFGGKGANQAVAAKRAGADVTFIAAVGADAFGGQMLEQFRREGLNVEHVKVVQGKPTGVALILVDAEGRNMIAVHPGANHALTPEDVALLPDSVFAGPGVFVAQLETPLETVRAALRRARAGGLFTILNPAPVPAGQADINVFLQADLLVPNETELVQLLDTRAKELEGVGKQHSRFQNKGQSLLITAGEQGCYLLPGNSHSLADTKVHIPALRVKTVDTVAAGDAFVGALACWLTEHEQMHETSTEHLISAAKWATHAAALSVTRHGAQPSLPYREEIERSFSRSPES